MFDLVHAMRTRIITSPSFDGDRILGAILFEDDDGPRDRGTWSADYLWSVKHVVPFLKVDKGLADEADGAQVMKPIPDLDDLLERAVGQRGVRHEDALGDQASPMPPVSPPWSISSSTSAVRSWPPAWFRSSSPRSTSTAPRRSAAEALLLAALTRAARPPR